MGRTITLKFNGAISNKIQAPAGVPQGSPLSSILYIFYNSNLLDVPRNEELALGFIDDIGYGTKGRTVEENAEKLKEMLEKAEEWRRKHGAQFEKSKYLIHFTRNHRINTEASIIMQDIKIEPVKEAKYLGVIFDQKLKFQSHVEQAVKKGMRMALAMAGIAKGKLGTGI